jgi:hypothetical protein
MNILYEKLFHFIWQFKLFRTDELTTVLKEPVRILSVGTLNTDAGPDFLNARIQINETIWAGHVELHLNSSDWHKHQHQTDPAYNNTILHVVYHYSGIATTANGIILPTLVLNDRINPDLFTRYEELMHAGTPLPCAHHLPLIKPITIQQQLDRMITERLYDKTVRLEELLRRYNMNWNEAFYVFLSRSYGLHINQDAFQELAQITPFTVLSKHRSDLIQLEALLFGQAGFLHTYFDSPYPQLLQREYEHLKYLHQLSSMPAGRWKFLRLRPANFPTIRIAQLAQLIFHHPRLLSLCIDSTSIQELKQQLSKPPSDFWQTHYTLIETSKEKDKRPGESFLQSLLINAFIPFLFLYGKHNAMEGLCERALQFLQELQFETNTQTQYFPRKFFPHQHAADSQALIQLKRKYCDAKGCLECSIGYEILR